MTTKIFLDLEETIITSFNEGLLCNLSTVKAFVERFSPKSWDGTVVGTPEVSIFSFAIWTSKDRDIFERNIRGPIERGLGVRIIDIPTVEDIAASIKKHQKIHFGIHDIISGWGKHRSFFDWCRFEEDQDCVLLDDVVPNQLLINKDTGLSTETVNLFTYKKQLVASN